MSTSSNTSFEFGVNHNDEFKLMPLTYENGSLQNINVPKMDFEEMVSYLKRKIRRWFTHLYYAMPPTNTIHGMKSIKSDYDTDVMYDIAKVTGKIQIYVSHHPIDLSTELIPNDGSLEEAYAAQGKLEIYIDHMGVNFVIAKYICPNATLAEMMNHVITDYTSDNEDERKETVVARMVEMHMGSDGKFVTRIGFVRTFVMGIGYDMMIVMVDDRVLDGCRMVVAHMLEIV
ncbi:hypothetical protein Tco_0451686 [Tanacetum coccineum]